MIKFFISIEFPWRLKSNVDNAEIGTLMDKAHPSRWHKMFVNVCRCLITICLLNTPPLAAAAALSPGEANRIGKKIWQNECNGPTSGLTSWNSGENFASLGIGHFIWYPIGQRGPFEESFPPLLSYLKESGVTLPPWLAESHGCPWPDRAAFLADLHSAR